MEFQGHIIYKNASKWPKFGIAIVYFTLLHQDSPELLKINHFSFYFRVDWRKQGESRIEWSWGEKSCWNWRKNFELLSNQPERFKEKKSQEIFHLHSVWEGFLKQI